MPSKETVAHVAFGVLTAVVSTIQPALAVINTAVYVLYQLDQYLHIKDTAYEEILEFAIGLALGEIVLLILHLI